MDFAPEPAAPAGAMHWGYSASLLLPKAADPGRAISSLFNADPRRGFLQVFHPIELIFCQLRLAKLKVEPPQLIIGSGFHRLEFDRAAKFRHSLFVAIGRDVNLPAEIEDVTIGWRSFSAWLNSCRALA